MATKGTSVLATVWIEQTTLDYNLSD